MRLAAFSSALLIGGALFAGDRDAATTVRAGDVVAVQAGTIHTVSGETIEGGGTVLISSGRIQAIGKNVSVPPGARVVDYGQGAVIAPGLVAADSGYGRGTPSPRTADPALLAVDHIDEYSDYYPALTAGITTLYVAPARGRLIAGQGAVMKSASGGGDERVLLASSAIQGSISREARRTPGYWKPPVPATADVGIGQSLPQLPRTTMGAVVALEELLAFAGGTSSDGAALYGERAGPVLAELIAAGRPWRMGAHSSREIRALVDFFSSSELPWILDGATEAADVAQELAAAGVPVIVSFRSFEGDGFGRGPDADWPRYDSAAKLVDAGVKVAIAPSPRGSTDSLRFAAGLAMRGGLSAEDALRAITLNAAQILGVDDRVGSLAVGRDADLVVFSGAPLDPSSQVIDTWIGGEVAFAAASIEAASTKGGPDGGPGLAAAAGHRDRPVVLEVDSLYLGDGTVLSPGQVAIQGGKIRAVGRSVSRPPGATVVRGPAAMPGMIDAMGHLGLEGAKKDFPSKLDLHRLAEPGDFGDRQVARAGVTTVVLASRAKPTGGTPTLAYKPASRSMSDQVLSAPNSVRLQWTDSDRGKSGDAVRKVLEKAKEYTTKWEEYETALAEWKPEAEEPEDDEADEEDDDSEGDEEEAKEPDDKKKKKKKKKKDEDEPARPITGVWEGELAEAIVRLRVLDEEGALSGNLRASALSDQLIEIEGERTEKDVVFEGLGSNGRVKVAVTLSGEELTGTAEIAGEEHELKLKQTSKDWVVAQRTARKRVEESEPKGKPTPPKMDTVLEPIRQSLSGRGSVVVTVTRTEEIVECVDAFAEFGIRPVLFDAPEAYRVAEDIRDRVAGVIPGRRILDRKAETGLRSWHRFAELSSQGIPVAFHSAAEEAAVELPLFASLAVAQGMSPEAALRALTSDVAQMMAIEDRVGRIEVGMDADVLLLSGAPLLPSTAVLRVWVNGEEIRER